MARRPQLEDGYTRIANEILEQAARHRLNGTQFRLLMIIWRYTYGYRRKEAEFTLSFLADAIGASRSQVDRELTALIERNVLEVVAGGSGKPRLLLFNKDFSTWLQPEPRERKKREHPKPPSKPARKREKRTYDKDSTYYRMAAYFHGKVREMAAEIGFNHASITKADLQKWADDFRLMVERDGVTDKHMIREVIDWVTQDEFWRVNVISAKKLREKFPELALKMKSRGSPQQRQAPKESMIDRLAAAQEWIDAGGDPYEFEPDN
ncbi:replication protein [Paenibacillus ginsengihumi]|uniref:replication protein n=1 Tax=Paenibacillus ginsengihumi TaxID=431596 RepID=UPI00037665D3|nr:replication protein [Paenibacillus ginsengihumi]